jgi:hypothetical protein
MSEYRNIFGEVVPIPEHLIPVTGEKRKRKEPIPRGHYRPKGTGPAGETCGSCKHLYRNQMAKTYLKCGLATAIWTGGRASDVRAKDAACEGWEPKP